MLGRRLNAAARRDPALQILLQTGESCCKQHSSSSCLQKEKQVRRCTFAAQQCWQGLGHILGCFMGPALLRGVSAAGRSSSGVHVFWEGGAAPAGPPGVQGAMLEAVNGQSLDSGWRKTAAFVTLTSCSPACRRYALEIVQRQAACCLCTYSVEQRRHT